MAWLLEENTRPYVLGLLGAIFAWLFFNSESRKLRHIPTVGHSSPILSYISAFRFLFHGGEMVKEGVDRFGDRPFKVPLLDRWIVIVHGDRYMEELRKAPDNVLSFEMAVDEFLQIPYTMGPEITTNPYHIPIVRSQLTRNLGRIFPELQEEIVDACKDFLPPTKDWKAFHAMNTFIEVVARASNRTFVGLPLCRNAEFLAICKAFTLDVVKVSSTMNLLPPFLRPLSSYVLSHAYRRIQTSMKYLEPEITRYREKRAAGEEMPANLLTWLLDEAQGEEQSIERLSRRILTLNFAAIHTTTVTFLHALYNLAAHPEYIPELRKEIEEAVAEEGWTKSTLDKMKKTDSFFKETQRLTPLGCLTSSRKALKEFTFKDGTYIPKNAVVAVAIDPSHLDNSTYPNPEQFDAFRFAKKNENESLGTSMVTLNNDFLAFGLGKHGCPGRFFAANELKLLLSYIVMNYDVKLAGTERPKDTLFGPSRIPNMKAEVMFRKRTLSA
ncbi:cytochrome P450 [Cyathus striatus]|nr:cytochrome P450 [Cyathus striatus]